MILTSMKVNIIFIIVLYFFLAACSGNDKKNTTEPEKELAKGEFKADTTEVEVMVLQKVPFKKQLVSNGRVRAKDKSTIGFKTSGTIEKIFVANGDYVKAGDILAVLDATDVENSMRSTLLNYEKARIDLNDKIIGFGYAGINDSIPEKTLELAKVHSGYNVSELNLENAKLNLEACTLRAPFAGRVANLAGRRYERSSNDFCAIINDSRLIVDFAVLETELDFVKKGSHVRVASFFDPENYVDGAVTSVNPTVNDKGQVTVEAEIPNNGSYIDGMNIKIYVESELPGQLVVPKGTVVLRDNLEVLFRYSKNRAQWTYVHTLNENSGDYVVTANTLRGADLAPGDTVIISGNQNLANETVVKISGQ